LGITQNKANNVKDSTREYYSDFRIFLRQNAWKLWEHAIKGYVGEANAEDSENSCILSLADVVQIIDLYCDNPRLFQKIVVTVNPLNDSPDAIVRAMTLSFARSITEAREVGAGDADKKAVVQGWRFHFQLERSKCSRFNAEVTTYMRRPHTLTSSFSLAYQIAKQIKSRWRAILYALYIWAGFSTTLVAVIDGEPGGLLENATPWIAMALAAIVSLCSGILSLISADSHINQIEVAQAKLANEILRFRMRVGKYSLSARERSEDDETNNKKGDKKPVADRRAGTQSLNISKEMHDCRSRFARSMEIIMQDLSSIDLYYHKSAQRSEKQKESTQFKEYVQSQLHLESLADKRNDVTVSGLMTPEDYFSITSRNKRISCG
jgi:hypothetical protein